MRQSRYRCWWALFLGRKECIRTSSEETLAIYNTYSELLQICHRSNPASSYQSFLLINSYLSWIQALLKSHTQYKRMTEDFLSTNYFCCAAKLKARSHWEQNTSMQQTSNRIFPLTLKRNRIPYIQLPDALLQTTAITPSTVVKYFYQARHLILLLGSALAKYSRRNGNMYKNWKKNLEKSTWHVEALQAFWRMMKG